ncbi:MAG: acetylhydrolase [Proteobacteria bacterium]|nr:acetylhydrolase [Pseudomonadota bacterium]MDA0993661.1 acetylhydrolase [Pseudomonadota bacterium]
MKNANATIVTLILLVIAACDAQVPQSVSESSHDTPYAVGSSTFFIHDESRSYDSVAGVDSGVRTLITEIWYPVDHGTLADNAGGYRRATYGDYVFGDREVHRLMMTKTTFFHLTPDTVREDVTDAEIDAAIEELFLRERASYVDAPLAATSEGWPVIVMTHGDAGSRYNMETACEYLAAHGYVVIAPEHTGNSPYSLTGRDPALATDGGNPELRDRMAEVMTLLSARGTYGSEEHYGQSYTPLSEGRGSVEFLRYFDQSLLQRLNDLRAALNKLDLMNSEGFAGAGEGALDLDRIGLMGRSYGGATTLMGLAMEPRFTAGFAVVPPGWADPRSSLPEEALALPGEESVVLFADGPFPLTTISKPTVLLSGAEDALIIGLAASQASAGGMPVPTPVNPHPLLRQAYQSTAAPVIWGLLADSNHATFGVSGGYWWPDLKTNTQARYFEPDTEFELISPGIAHQMQKELALAFFDLTIREDESARNRLLENRYQNEGLTLESRNFPPAVSGQ